MKLNKVCLNKSKQKILQNLEAEWPDQGLVVLLGANGAGKSSLLNLLAAIESPDSGVIECNQRVTRFLMPEPAKFYPQLTVSEQLSFVAHLCQQPFKQEQQAALLKNWQLNPVANKLTKHLSLGYRQRLSLAQLELSAADVLLMDEPMNGMDPQVMQIFKDKIMTWKLDKLVVMATHILHEAQQMADWVVVMECGQIILSEAYQAGVGFHEIYQQAIQQHHLQMSAEKITS
ncbi:MAG: ABC transporter ATP-binding protein [Marinicella sp.]|nr:ABC transporter ATP-binding protein [Xanthomonadales bacterium]